jgi:hypothetical protein
LVPTTNFAKNVHSSPCGFLLEMVAIWFNRLVHYHYRCHGEVYVATTILSYFLFGNKASTWPTKMDLIFHVPCHSPNLNKFAKAICNVVSTFSLHSRGFGLEGKTCSMFVKRKLDENSHRHDKSIYIINIPMTNFPPSIHRSKFGSLVHSIFNSTTQCWWHQLKHLISRNSQRCNTFEAYYVPTTPLGVVVTQFKVRMVENYVPLDNCHLQRTTNPTWITCCVVAFANDATQCSTFIKQKGPIIAPCFFEQLYNRHHPQGLEKLF